MKIVIGSLQCEGNTLTPIRTTFADFDYAPGEAMYAKLKDATEFFESQNCELIPTLYARALPGGTVVYEDFIRLADELVDAIPTEGVDGIWLYLHGAMHVDKIGSGEEYVLKKVRAKVGFDIPISLTLDFHANNSDGVTKYANCVAGYRTAPHKDREETQIRAAKMLIKCINEKLLPKPQMARADAIICGDAVQTAVEPLAGIMKMALEMESIPGILSAEVFNGQSWVDEPYMSPTFIVTHENDTKLAAECAQKLAKEFWDKRYDFKIDHVEPEQAIALAMAAKEKQVFLCDSGDNTTAGATGDNAYMLNRLREAGAKGFLLAGITDAEAVNECFNAEIGDEVSLKIGGKLDVRNESAIITGKLLNKGDLVNYTGGAGIPSALIDCGDMTVIVSKDRAPLCRPDILDSIEPNWRNYKIVVVKLGYLFPELAAVAERSILAFTPGNSTQRLKDMHHHNIRRPMYPLEDNFV